MRTLALMVLLFAAGCGAGIGQRTTRHDVRQACGRIGFARQETELLIDSLAGFRADGIRETETRALGAQACEVEPQYDACLVCFGSATSLVYGR